MAVKHSKQVIIITGYPGAGKTTLSKILEDKLNFKHIEYDKHRNVISVNNWKWKYIILDAIHFYTKSMYSTIEFYKNYNYQINIIHLDTNIDRCNKNIRIRKRHTIDFNKIDIDFKYLMNMFDLNLIVIKDYMLDKININYDNIVTEKIIETYNSLTGKASPTARKILTEKNIDYNKIIGTGKNGRITNYDAINS